MIPHDSRIDVAIQNSHTLATQVDITNVARTLESGLLITDGNIKVDATANIRRSADLTLIDPTGTFTVDDVDDLLAPFGNRFRPYRGVEVNGVKYMVSQGVFHIYDYKVNDNGDTMTIQLQGNDLSYLVDRAKFRFPWYVPAGSSSYSANAKLILDFAYPLIQYNTNLATLTGTVSLPAILFDTGSSPWVAAKKLLADSGYDMYFNTDGLLTAVPTPNLGKGQISWTYAEGDDAMILSLTKEYNTDQVFNHFIVTGEPTDGISATFAEAFDDDIGSPTYYKGPFGDVVSIYTSNLIVDPVQAQRLVDGQFATRGGAVESVTFNSIPHPAHDVYDIIQVRRAKSKVDDAYMIQSMTLPMAAERSAEFTCFNRTAQLGR